MEPITCLLFYLVINRWEVSAWKLFTKNHMEQDQQQENYIQMFQQEHTKWIKHYYVDFWMNTHSFLPPSPSFLKVGNEISKKFAKRSNFKKIFGENQEWRKEEKQRLQGRWCFFIFIFSILAIMVTGPVFGKFSLANTLSKWVIPGTSKHWLYHTGLLVFSLKFRVSPVCE